MPLAPGSLVVLAALAAGPFPPPLAAVRSAASEARPTARPSPRAKATTKPRIKVSARKTRRAAVRPIVSKLGTAAVAGLLKAYVDGKAGGKFSRDVTGRLPKDARARAAAQRVLARVEGAPKGSLRKAIGSTKLSTSVAKSTLAAEVGKVFDHGHIVFLMPAIPLPPEEVKPPAKFQLTHTGLVTNATEDADGTDELTSFVMLATVESDDTYELQTVDIGSGQSSAVGTNALTKLVWNAAPAETLAISVVIEDDAGNAAAAREEVELLVELAASVAETMPGTDRLAVLHTMVDYTIGVDTIGADPSRAARSVVATRIAGTEWVGLWGADATKSGGVSYKVAVPHQMGSGSYDMLFDVPAAIPKMTTIRLTLTNFSGLKLPPNSVVESASIRAYIKGESYTFALNQPSGFQPLERKVIDGDALLEVSGSVKYEYPKVAGQYSDWILDYCKKADTDPKIDECKDRKKKWDKHAGEIYSTSDPIDFAAGNAVAYFATYSTAGGGFRKVAKAGADVSTTPPAPTKPIGSQTTKGSEIPWASITLRAMSW
jgi:hypothetical protein